MPLEQILQRLQASGCLLGERTSHSDSGVRVSIAPRKNETILFFKSDSEQFREHFQRTDSRQADLVIYAKAETSLPGLLVLELKAGKPTEAIEQMKGTCGALAIAPADRERCLGLIVSRQGAHRDDRQFLQKLQRSLGIEICVKSVPRGKWLDLREHVDQICQAT